MSAGREMFRLEQLDLIAREKVKKLRFFDEIEVFLGYQNKLKESLELTGTTEGMQFFGASRITELDLKAAEIQVKSAENSQFREWILQWEPLHGVLKRRESKQWQTLIDKKMEDYEREYQQLSDTELKPAGLLGDIEAERTIGARAMASAEKAFQQGLHPLAEQLLGRHLEARWVLDTPPVYHSLA
ncbi:NEL-type E3 ubiquitin ligase domain-containing protein [Edwardsiella ictaluri]|uniref:NEL-type E3 ubiquitin ligase domain-containing protein n=1 Tax=Edwardsiella ictaluri TaxID=67780 RepID=UPI0035E27ABC